MNDGETCSRRHAWKVHALSSKKGRRRLSRQVKQNRHPTITQTDSPIQCRSEQHCFGVHSSAHTVGYGNTQQITHVHLLTNHYRQLLCLRWIQELITGSLIGVRGFSGRMNHDLSFITSMALSGQVVFQVNSVPPVYSRCYIGRLWRCNILGDVLMAVFSIHGFGRTDHESCGLYKHNCRPVAPGHGICFPNCK